MLPPKNITDEDWLFMRPIMQPLRDVYPLEEVRALISVHMEWVNIDITGTDIAMEYRAIDCSVVDFKLSVSTAQVFDASC